MFSNLFFVLLVLTVINFAPDSRGFLWNLSSIEAFKVGLACYALVLFFIYWHIRLSSRKSRFSTQSILILINLELVAFLAFYHFGLGAQRLFTEGPTLASLQTPFLAFSLFLYAGGIGWAHYWLARFRSISASSPIEYASIQLQLAIPFCLPFLIFSVFFDGLGFIPGWNAWIRQANEVQNGLALIGLSLFFLGVTLVLMPPLIVKCWRCKPLKDLAIIASLQQICRQTGFKHGGFKVWGAMKHSFTAGIIGVVPRFRYVMFTPRLLSEFSHQEIEAILIHEIGHSYYKHLLFYPFIFLGMTIAAALVSLFYTDSLARFFDLQNNLYPSRFWTFLYSLSLFTLYAFVLGLYFRFVFGFFSRLFERQADLHIFHYSISPIHMIRSLDHIGVVTGNSHHCPSWHHYSLQERIQFLQQAMINPDLVPQHHKKVKRWLAFYFFLLGLSLAGLFYSFV